MDGRASPSSGRRRTSRRSSRELGTARLVGSEQSNSSVVFDEALILKVFRRLEPGINPELELLRFLAEHGFRNTPALAGWYAYSGGPLTATLGLLQEYVADASRRLGARARRDRGRRRSASSTGSAGSARSPAQMHTVLGSDPNDPPSRPRSRASSRSGC